MSPAAQPHHIARHQHPDRHLDAARRRHRQPHAEIRFGLGRGVGRRRAPHDGRGVAHQRLQRIGRPAGPGFLPEAQHSGKRHHRPDHGHGFQVIGPPGDRSQQGQQQVEGIAVAMPQMPPPGHRFFVAHFVEADPRADRLGLPFSQAVDMAAEPGEQGVPVVQSRGCQVPGQCVRRFAADARAQDGIEHDAPAEMPGHAADLQKVREEVFQDGDAHSCSPGRHHPGRVRRVACEAVGLGSWFRVSKFETLKKWAGRTRAPVARMRASRAISPRNVRRRGRAHGDRAPLRGAMRIQGWKTGGGETPSGLPPCPAGKAARRLAVTLPAGSRSGIDNWVSPQEELRKMKTTGF